MGVLDALTILAAGAGKGYRASQEIQRQIAEAKRKALMDEREQAMRDRATALQERLGASTIASEEQARLESQFKLGEARRESLEASQPFAPPEGFRPTILGTEFNIPNRMSALESPAISNLLQQEIQARAAREAVTIRGRSAVSIANIRSGFRKEAGTPIERRTKYIQRAMTPPNPFMDVTDQINYMNAIIAVAQQLDAEAFADSTGIKPGANKPSNSGVTKSGIKYTIER